MWSSVGMQPYMSYTIHYIDSNWKLQNKCLQTQFLPEDHTGVHLSEAMEAALSLWELDSANQVCLTTDNGSNIVSAGRILDWPRLSCFCHNLHLSITKAIKGTWSMQKNCELIFHELEEEEGANKNPSKP